jgi:hypothetical protein
MKHGSNKQLSAALGLDLYEFTDEFVDGEIISMNQKGRRQRGG